MRDAPHQSQRLDQFAVECAQRGRFLGIVDKRYVVKMPPFCATAMGGCPHAAARAGEDHLLFKPLNPAVIDVSRNKLLRKKEDC